MLITDRRIRLAIADSDFGFRMLLKFVLPLYGDVEVVAEAEDPGEALAIVEQHQPDALVLNLAMSKADGLEILNQISRSTRVIVVSGDDELKENVLELGADAFVVKGEAVSLISALVNELAG